MNSSDIRSNLENAIAKLPPDYRAVYILRDIDELSNKEVSAILNIGIPAIKSRLHRSRLMLKKRLFQTYNEYKGISGEKITKSKKKGKPNPNIKHAA
jgi:RNA polymerase sigma-70 factor (ECF subfamily)